jgi:CO dehydrogenase/acetyl-CoA synthase epsilon subunit
MSTEPWQRYELAGLRAIVIQKADTVAAMLRKARRPVIIAGRGVAGDALIAAILSRIAKATGAVVYASPVAAATLRENGLPGVVPMPVLEAGARISGDRSPAAANVPDLVLIIGVDPVIANPLEEGLRSFGPRSLRIVALDRHYRPHASFAFGNIGRGEWE